MICGIVFEHNTPSSLLVFAQYNGPTSHCEMRLDPGYFTFLDKLTTVINGRSALATQRIFSSRKLMTLSIHETF